MYEIPSVGDHLLLLLLYTLIPHCYIVTVQPGIFATMLYSNAKSREFLF